MGSKGGIGRTQRRQARPIRLTYLVQVLLRISIEPASLR